MKKRIFIITILSIAMLTACNESGKTNDISKNGQDKKQAEKLEINTKKDSDKEEAKEAKEEKETQDNDTTSESDENKESKSETETKKDVTISVFYSNDDATAFTADMVKIKELTPENVLNALADKGVIDKDIKINKFEVSEIDGMQSINIDFDQKFKEYINPHISAVRYFVLCRLRQYAGRRTP